VGRRPPVEKRRLATARVTQQKPVDYKDAAKKESSLAVGDLGTVKHGGEEGRYERPVKKKTHSRLSRGSDVRGSVPGVEKVEKGGGTM